MRAGSHGKGRQQKNADGGTKASVLQAQLQQGRRNRSERTHNAERSARNRADEAGERAGCRGKGRQAAMQSLREGQCAQATRSGWTYHKSRAEGPDTQLQAWIDKQTALIILLWNARRSDAGASTVPACRPLALPADCCRAQAH